jgi:pentapeptide repeat protein
MIQVTARHAKLTGADLTGVDFTQADLTGADLSGAKLSGASFNQATLTGATLTGATGVAPWSTYLLAAAGALLVLLVLGSVRRVARATRLQGGPRSRPSTAPPCCSCAA